MKHVTVYEANDGTRFKTEADCLRYEEFLPQFDAVMAILPQAIESNFANGHGYIQHTNESLLAFQNAASLLIAKYVGPDEANKFDLNPRGVVGRILDDGETIARKCSEFCYRIYRIDFRNREWGQAYYANQSRQGDQVKWPNVRRSE